MRASCFHIWLALALPWLTVVFASTLASANLVARAPPVKDNDNNNNNDNDKDKDKDKEDGITLPPLLTKDNFDQFLSNGLHLVEFFSPYCIHCKQLEPLWKKVYQDTKDEAKKLGIDMLQVNCVEQGDLCDREAVKFYPNLRVYGPNEHNNGGRLLVSFPLNIQKTEENLKAFIKDSAFQFGDTDKLNLPSKSNMLDTPQLMEILTGKSAEPILISFWPSNDKKFNDINKHEDVFSNCPTCTEFQSVWNILSNRLADDIKVGHVNCESNSVVCRELGYSELLLGVSRARFPRIAAVLPRTTGNLIKYTGSVSANNIVSWTKRFLQNYKVESVDPYDLSQKMKLVNRLVNEPKDDLPGENDNKISFVYLYDDDKSRSTPEDFEVLPYLLDPIMKLPDIYLFKSNDTGFKKLIERQTKNMLRYIHYNDSEPIKEFNQELFVHNTVTSMPTLVGFKENSLVPVVFQNFEPKDIRNSKLVESFIRQNSLPFISELTPSTFKRVFNLKNSNVDKVVVAFFDTSDPGHTHESLNKLSLAAHDYHYYWSEFSYRSTQLKRTNKAEKVAKLKSKDAKSTEITKAMASEIIYDNAGQTVFTYLDLAKFRNLIDEKGWNISGKKKFEKGDAIIIERTGKFYYENDIYGNFLKNEPWILRNTLMSFHDSNYVVKPLKKNLINSPYGNYLRHMDYIHRHGVKGYFFVFVAFVALIMLLKKHNRRISSIVGGYGFGQKYRKLSGGGSNKNGLGILGNIPSDDRKTSFGLSNVGSSAGSGSGKND